MRYVLMLVLLSVVCTTDSEGNKQDCETCTCSTSIGGHDPKAEKNSDGIYVTTCEHCGCPM